MKREWLLCLLASLFILLSILDPSLPQKSLMLIDYESLSTITSFFIISRGLEMSGIFDRVAQKIVNFSGSEFKIIGLLSLIVSLSSAIIMNDTAMFVFIPLILSVSKIAKINVSKAVTAVAISANVGSALSPIGNPQNIIIWRSYKVPIFEFVHSILPYVILWILFIIVFVYFGSKNRRLEIKTMPKVKIKKSLMLTSITLLLIVILFVESGYFLAGLALTILIFAIVGREVVFSLDLALLAIFALIFIDFKELSFIPIIATKLSAREIVVAAAFLSQLISNVPTTVLLSAQKYPWLPLAIGSNIGGTGTVIGSLANFIAIRIAGVKLREFHRYSIPYFLVTLTATLLLI